MYNKQAEMMLCLYRALTVNVMNQPTLGCIYRDTSISTIATVASQLITMRASASTTTQPDEKRDKHYGEARL